MITGPTSIDANRRPDLAPLLKASETVIERILGLSYREDFHAGYSPEPINPSDKAHRVTDIVKVTSGSSPAVADFVDADTLSHDSGYDAAIRAVGHHAIVERGAPGGGCGRPVVALALGSFAMGDTQTGADPIVWG